MRLTSERVDRANFVLHTFNYVGDGQDGVRAHRCIGSLEAKGTGFPRNGSYKCFPTQVLGTILTSSIRAIYALTSCVISAAQAQQHF